MCRLNNMRTDQCIIKLLVHWITDLMNFTNDNPQFTWQGSDIWSQYLLRSLVSKIKWGSEIKSCWIPKPRLLIKIDTYVLKVAKFSSILLLRKIDTLFIEISERINTTSPKDTGKLHSFPREVNSRYPIKNVFIIN